MSKPPKPAPAKKPKAEKPKAVAKAKTPAKAKKVVAPVENDAEAPVVKPVRVEPAAAPAGAADPALAKRLAEMTDFALRAYQQSTARISRDPKHAKSASAKLTLASIEIEMARRVASPGSAPSGVRVGVAKPKSEIAKSGKGRG